MKLLLYCTKQPHKLYSTDKGYVITDFELGNFYKTKEKLNGKIVAECDYEVDTIAMQKGAEDRIYGNNGFMGYGVIKKNGSFNWYDENKACLSEKELFKYLEGFEKPYLIQTNYKCKIGYAIHIKDLHVFDEPRELNNYSQYEYERFSSNYGCIGTEWKQLEKAPQNMMYCYDEGEKKILISTRPEWLCKILNGEKTIEVRKKILKEMLK